MTRSPHAEDAGRQQARLAALLFGAAALVTALSLVLPHQPEVDGRGLVVVAVGGAVAAMVLLLGGERLPSWAYQVALAWATVLVSLALLFNGERSGGAAGGDELYYLWVVIYAAYYFPRRAVAAQVLLITVAYAVTLWLIDPGPIAPSRWLTVAGLVVGTAVVVRLLSERIDRLIAELGAAARTDWLTGLPNRRAFEEQFSRESARADRSLRPLAVVTADVDRFKEINDRFGHAAGDAALVRVAAALRDAMRAIDTPARLGGDEFAALLPETDSAEAQVVAQRLRDAIGVTHDGAGHGLSLSVGVAVHAPGEPLEHVMRSADESLYAAKRARAGAGRPAERLVAGSS